MKVVSPLSPRPHIPVTPCSLQVFILPPRCQRGSCTHDDVALVKVGTGRVIKISQSRQSFPKHFLSVLETSSQAPVENQRSRSTGIPKKSPPNHLQHTLRLSPSSLNLVPRTQPPAPARGRGQRPSPNLWGAPNSFFPDLCPTFGPSGRVLSPSTEHLAELRVEHFNCSSPINPNPLPGGEQARKKTPKAGLGLPRAVLPTQFSPSRRFGEELGAGGGVWGVADGERKLRELQAATKPPRSRAPQRHAPRAAALAGRRRARQRFPLNSAKR